METRIVEAYRVREAHAKAKLLGAPNGECFWLISKSFNEAWKNSAMRVHAIVYPEGYAADLKTKTMAGIPALECECLIDCAVLLDQSGKTWTRMELEPRETTIVK